MYSVFIETYDCLNVDDCVGVDVYDFELGFMIGEGYYHVSPSKLIYRDFGSGDLFVFRCSELDVVSVLSDFYDNLACE